MALTTNENSLAISFIICTYNRSKYLNETLKSLQECTLGDYTVELLVVDNNSTDDTAQVVKYHQELNGQKNVLISYVKENQQGLSYARNRGIVESKFDQIVFVDDDIRATENFVEGWYKFFKNKPEAEAVGGKIHVQFDCPKPKWSSYFILSLFGFHDLGNNHKLYPINSYPFGGNMGFRKLIFNSVGNFNTKLGRKGKNLGANEEKELFRRIRTNNKRIFYNPEALLYHRIDEKRATHDFIKKQAIGLGNSYKIEIQNGVTTLPSVYLLQISKMAVTILLAAAYTLAWQLPKASMLIKFRFWIFVGLHNQE